MSRIVFIVLILFSGEFVFSQDRSCEIIPPPAELALENAISAGKWENTYAATNHYEYWAEGVQSWFNVNADVPLSDGKHNHVNTREELKEYDPGLYAILAGYLNEVVFELSCHCNN